MSMEPRRVLTCWAGCWIPMRVPAISVRWHWCPSSPINRSGALFYSTLFDENAACHIAFGASYPGTTEGGTGLTKEQLEERGMNQSTIHEDVMIGAEDSHITGKCRDGRVVELFRNGVWVL